MFSNRAAPARPSPVESADKIVLVIILEPAMAFSRILMSSLFLMLRGM